MAKKTNSKYHATDEEMNAMNICNKNDLAYVIQPSKQAGKYNVVKFQITNYLKVFTLKEKETPLEFNEVEASKKTFELYKQHSIKYIYGNISKS